MQKGQSRFQLLVFYLFLLLLSACSGGSGGGGDDASGNAREGVRILHASIELAPLDVYSSISPQDPDSGAIAPTQRASFMQDVFFAPALRDEQVFSITTAKRPDNVSFTVPVDQDQLGRLTVVVFGDISTFGVRNTSFFEPEVEIPEGTVGIRVIHGVTRAQDIEASFNGQSVDAVTFGGVGEYIFIEPGDIEYLIRRKVDQRVIASGVYSLEEDKAYTFLVGGEVEYFVSVRPYLDLP